MVRLLSQLLALLAVLMAPLPAVAAAPLPTAAAVTAEAEHCEQAGADASHRDRDGPQEDAEHPCCKNSMSSCCPVAAPMSGSGSLSRVEATKSSHHARAETFVLGTSGPPLTEPPTFA